MKKTPDFGAATDFLAARGRVVDRRVFERLFCGGAAEPVRDAVAAYRNADGGFGHALEPDCRAAASQPTAVEMAPRRTTSRLVAARTAVPSPPPGLTGRGGRPGRGAR
jgi:hypothetical protein